MVPIQGVLVWFPDVGTSHMTQQGEAHPHASPILQHTGLNSCFPSWPNDTIPLCTLEMLRGTSISLLLPNKTYLTISPFLSLCQVIKFQKSQKKKKKTTPNKKTRKPKNQKNPYSDPRASQIATKDSLHPGTHSLENRSCQMLTLDPWLPTKSVSRKMFCSGSLPDLTSSHL